jgi:exosortase/archaeosortase family protein
MKGRGAGARDRRRLQKQRADAAADAVRAGNRRAQLRFALTFVLAAGALFSLYAFPYAERGRVQRWFGVYLAGYARLAGHVLGLFDSQVRVVGNVIAGRGSLAIVKTCDAMEANLLFFAAVLAVPARWSRKAVAAVLGTALLVAVNVARICSLYFVGIYFPGAFEFIHIEVWPALLIIVATAEFAAWALWMARARGPALAAGSEA